VGSNPLRSSTSAEQALQRLFEAPTRAYARPVDALRETLLDIKEHDAAVEAGARAGVRAVLEQLAPSNVADQVESGRARALPPGQDPRPRYWEHFAEFYRVLTQASPEGLPYPFTEQFRRTYEEARAAARIRRRGRENGSSE
jgi:predicted component of type VI protein secretion system